MPSVKGALRRLERLIWSRRAYKFVVRDWQALSDLPAAMDMLATMRCLRNLEPLELQPPVGKRILVLSPHPDDEVTGPGGTLIAAIRGGAQAKVIFLTSGRPGEREVREAEALAAARQVGFETVFCRHAEGAIPLDEDALGRLAAEVRTHRPDILFVPFPLDDHDDHRRTAELAVRLYQAHDDLPKPEVWAYQGYGIVLPNVVVDVSKLRADKVAAIACYQSELRRRDWTNFHLGVNAWHSRLLTGNRKDALAEAFFVVPIAEFVRFAETYFKHGPQAVYYGEGYRRG